MTSRARSGRSAWGDRRREHRPALLAALCLILLAVSAAAIASALRLPTRGWDFQAYCSAAAELAAGGDPIGKGIIPFVYPPLAAWLFAPVCAAGSGAYPWLYGGALLAAFALVQRGGPLERLVLATLMAGGFSGAYWTSRSRGDEETVIDLDGASPIAFPEAAEGGPFRPWPRPAPGSRSAARTWRTKELPVAPRFPVPVERIPVQRAGFPCSRIQGNSGRDAEIRIRVLITPAGDAKSPGFRELPCIFPAERDSRRRRPVRTGLPAPPSQ